MKMPGRLFLVGPMGAGKTTIGRQLARLLNRPFYDSDREIEVRTGVDIPLIFELEGEQGFRKREQAVIDELTQCPSIVLATGGGVVLDPNNRRHLTARGFVIYLQTSVASQLSRTRRDRSRPLLQTRDPGTRLEELMREREPLYRAVADLTINTDDHAAKDIAQRILHIIRARAKWPGPAQ